MRKRIPILIYYYQLPAPEPTPEPSFPTRLLPAKSQADRESLPQQLHFDYTSFRLSDLGELVEPPARPKHSISADILTDHINEGKRTRNPSDRRAAHATISTFRTQDPYAIFHATFPTLNRTHRPRHQSEMPPVLRNFDALINHPEREGFFKA